MSSTSTLEVHTEGPQPRRRPPTPKRPRSQSQPCHPLPPSVSFPLPVLASLRILVLSHLSELEQCISSIEMPTSESLMSKGEAKAEEVVEMLRRIRVEVKSHLPEVPFDVHGLEDLLSNHLHDLPYPSLLDDLRAHLPEMRRPSISLSDMQSRIQDVRSHIHDMSVDLSQSMNYLPVLSRHLDSLHSQLSSMDASSFPSLPSTATLLQLLDRLLSSDLVPSVLHRVDGHDSPFEKVAKDMSNTLKKSLDGSKLVHYVDLPREWRNNPWVGSGYRFIPLHRWPIIILSLFALHNETLNIHTHMIPLLHTAGRFVLSLNYASVPVDRPETIYTLFAMLCLLSSVIWHTMSGCAHRVSMELCARVDYVGIGWLISASVGSLVYYGFSCQPQAILVYLSLCLITGVMGSIFPFMPWFNERRYKPVRVAFFIGMSFTGLAPLAHLSYEFGARNALGFIEPIMPSLASYIIGLAFYVTHIPERFVYSERIARWTDWLGGGSHAIWHALIVLAIYQHKWGMRTLRDGIAGESCLA